MTFLQASQQCDTIVGLIDDDVPESAWDTAAEFFESVRDGVVDMQETIDDTGFVTTKQQKALDNWEAGVRKWIN